MLGHEGQPHQPAADEHRGGGHADHGGVHPLQRAHVHHGGQIRDLGTKSTALQYTVQCTVFIIRDSFHMHDLICWIYEQSFYLYSVYF